MFLNGSVREAFDESLAEHRPTQRAAELSSQLETLQENLCYQPPEARSLRSGLPAPAHVRLAGWLAAICRVRQSLSSCCTTTSLSLSLTALRIVPRIPSYLLSRFQICSYGLLGRQQPYLAFCFSSMYYLISWTGKRHMRHEAERI